MNNSTTTINVYPWERWKTFFLVRSLGTVFGVVETSREVVLLLTSTLGPSRTFQWLHRIDFFFFVSCSRLDIADVGGRQRFIGFSWNCSKHGWETRGDQATRRQWWFECCDLFLKLFLAIRLLFERKDSRKLFKSKNISKLILEFLQIPLDKTLKLTQ